MVNAFLGTSSYMICSQFWPSIKFSKRPRLCQPHFSLNQLLANHIVALICNPYISNETSFSDIFYTCMLYWHLKSFPVSPKQWYWIVYSLCTEISRPKPMILTGYMIHRNSIWLLAEVYGQHHSFKPWWN